MSSSSGDEDEMWRPRRSRSTSSVAPPSSSRSSVSLHQLPGVMSPSHTSLRSLPSQSGRSMRSLPRIGSVDNFIAVPALAEMTQVDLTSAVNLEKLEEKGLDFRTYFFLNAVPEWRRAYIHYNKLLRLLTQVAHHEVQRDARNANESDASVDKVHISPYSVYRADDGSTTFVSALGAELEKVEAFHLGKIKYFRDRFAQLSQQMRRVQGKEYLERELRPVAPEESQVFLMAYMKELRERRQLHVVKDSFKSAVYEFVRGLGMVQGYCSLNKLAALNLINKYEAVAEDDPTLPHIVNTVTAMVEHCTFLRASEELTVMEEQIKALFTDTFYPTQREHAKDVMGPVRLKRKYQRASFVIGLCLGLSAAMVVLGIYLMAITPDVQALPSWQSNYLIFRFSTLVLLAVWFTGINMYAWTKARINFRFIAEVGRRRIAYHTLFIFVGPLTVASCLLFTLYLFAARGDIPSVMPVRFFGFIQMVMLLAVLLCPFDVLLRSTRLWLLRKTGRVVSAPLWPIRFVDFYLGDQFTSLVVALYDLEYALCFIFSDVWTGDSVCLTQAPVARLCLAGLPGLWRLLQCARRYRDTRDVTNLWNIGKYASGLVVVLFAGLSRGLESSSGVTPLRATLIAFSVVATLYGCAWDLLRDFGFFSRGTKHRFLRNELLYSRRWVYYAIIPADVLLRCTWIFTIAPGAFGITLPQDLFVFCLSLSELTRRFLWNFFRMENESATNCGNFRAIKDVPLPFDDSGNDKPSGDAMSDSEDSAVAARTAHFDGEDFDEVRAMLAKDFDDEDDAAGAAVRRPVARSDHDELDAAPGEPPAMPLSRSMNRLPMTPRMMEEEPVELTLPVPELLPGFDVDHELLPQPLVDEMGDMRRNHEEGVPVLGDAGLDADPHGENDGPLKQPSREMVSLPVIAIAMPGAPEGAEPAAHLSTEEDESSTSSSSSEHSSAVWDL